MKTSPRTRASASNLALLGVLWVQGFAGPGILAAGQRSATVGQPAPDFTLPDLQGRPVHLSDGRGEVVLLHFWATWCAHCAGEMKLLQQAVEKEDRKPPRVLAVNLGEPASRVRKFVRQMGLSYPILLDRRGKVAEAYGVVGLPATLVVSADGRLIRKLEMGALSAELLQDPGALARPPAP